MNWLQRSAFAFTNYFVAPEVGRQSERVVSENARLKETITELQLDMEDQGYRLMVTRSQTEFTRAGLDIIIQTCRLFFLKNPLIGRGVRVSSFYVFGRGVEITSPDTKAKDTLAAFFADPRNKAELSQSALVDAHNTLQTDGNLFYVLFPNQDDGTVQIRSLDAMEVKEIITNPDDASQPWFYKRAWMQEAFDLTLGVVNPQTMFCWYPALGYNPEIKPEMIGSWPVNWNTPVVHVKSGGLKKWRFGCPSAYPALDWATAYTRLLTDYCKKAANLARVGMTAKTKGGQASVNAITGKLNSTYATGQDYAERNPAPQTGSTFVSGEGVTLEALMTRGANSDPEEGRRVMLMVCNVFHLAEHMFGDASVGTRATTDSLERPTQLAFEAQQIAWKDDFFEPVSRYVLQVAKPAPNSRSELRAAKVDTEAVQITVSFPPIIEIEIDKAVTAAVNASTLMGFAMAGTTDPRTAVLAVWSPVIGQERAQKLAEDIYPEPYDPSDYAMPNPQDAPEPVAAPALPGGAPGSPQPARSSARQPASPKPKPQPVA